MRPSKRLPRARHTFLTTREAAAQGIQLGIDKTPKERRRWQGSKARKQEPDWYVMPALM